MGKPNSFDVEMDNVEAFDLFMDHHNLRDRFGRGSCDAVISGTIHGRPVHERSTVFLNKQNGIDAATVVFQDLDEKTYPVDHKARYQQYSFNSDTGALSISGTHQQHGGYLFIITPQ
jgi:hypothetical protein